MGTTASLALRYPEATDRVADGALAMQHLAEDVEAMLRLAVKPPRCHGYLNSALSPANGAAVLVPLDEELDTDGIHGAAGSTRMTIVTPGRYRVIGQACFNANATGFRTVSLLKNGGTIAASRLQAAPATASHYQQAVDEILCVAGDYLELQVAQGSGAALGMSTGAVNTFLHVAWAGLQ